MAWLLKTGLKVDKRLDMAHLRGVDCIYIYIYIGRVSHPRCETREVFENFQRSCGVLYPGLEAYKLHTESLGITSLHSEIL